MLGAEGGLVDGNILVAVWISGVGNSLLGFSDLIVKVTGGLKYVKDLLKLIYHMRLWYDFF